LYKYFFFNSSFNNCPSASVHSLFLSFCWFLFRNLSLVPGSDTFGNLCHLKRNYIAIYTVYPRIDSGGNKQNIFLFLSTSVDTLYTVWSFKWATQGNFIRFFKKPTLYAVRLATISSAPSVIVQHALTFIKKCNF
jgi:hypothetical protein